MPQIKFQPRISAAPISPLRSPLLPTFLPLGFCNEHQKRFVSRLPSGPRFAFAFYRSKRVESNGKTRFFSFLSLIRFIWRYIYLVFIYLFIYLYTYLIYIWIFLSFFFYDRKYSCDVINGFKKGIIYKIFFWRTIFFLCFFINIFFMLKIWIYLNLWKGMMW